MGNDWATRMLLVEHQESELVERGTGEAGKYDT